MNESLAGKRVLVVEDEYFIASDLKRILTRADVAVIGPAGNLPAALERAEREALDAAILDVNLAGDLSYALADRLAAAGIPYAFVTGYDDWSLPERYRDAPRITKPFGSAAVIALVEGLCSGRERP